MTRAKKMCCSVDGCTATFTHHYWGAVKAHDAGWFSQKDGTVYCPEHTPDWVAGWRATRNSKEEECSTEQSPKL